jgi:hypothetical protein
MLGYCMHWDYNVNIGSLLDQPIEIDARWPVTPSALPSISLESTLGTFRHTCIVDQRSIMPQRNGLTLFYIGPNQSEEPYECFNVKMFCNPGVASETSTLKSSVLRPAYSLIFTRALLLQTRSISQPCRSKTTNSFEDVQQEGSESSSFWNELVIGPNIHAGIFVFLDPELFLWFPRHSISDTVEASLVISVVSVIEMQSRPWCVITN